MSWALQLVLARVCYRRKVVDDLHDVKGGAAPAITSMEGKAEPQRMRRRQLGLHVTIKQ
jgi:hypothetical protein